MLNNSWGTVSEYLTGFLSWNFSGIGRFIPDTVDVWWNEPDPRKFPSHGNTCGEFGRPSNRTNVAGQFVTRLLVVRVHCQFGTWDSGSLRQSADKLLCFSGEEPQPGARRHQYQRLMSYPSQLSIDIENCSTVKYRNLSKLLWKEPNIR